MFRRSMLAVTATFVTTGVAQLSGCSSIDRTNVIQGARLAVGTAKKSEVVNAIGLPNRTIHDDVQHVEFWLYSGKPETSSFYFPTYYQVGRTIFYSTEFSEPVNNEAPVTLICSFDANGILIDIKRPEEIK